MSQPKQNKTKTKTQRLAQCLKHSKHSMFVNPTPFPHSSHLPPPSKPARLLGGCKVKINCKSAVLGWGWWCHLHPHLCPLQSCHTGLCSPLNMPVSFLFQCFALEFPLSGIFSPVAFLLRFHQISAQTAPLWSQQKPGTHHTVEFSNRFEGVPLWPGVQWWGEPARKPCSL